MASLGPQARIIQGDFRTPLTLEKITEAMQGRRPDLVMSDMAPNTCGDRTTDHFRSMDLSHHALSFADDMAAGKFLCKFFIGGDDKDLVDRARSLFSRVRVIKPKASRSQSVEAFLLATQ
eukprot:CAMPEP_0185776832 /NCGR_PEP_ID=MMETSP1174-20130828/87261_1 /TAXON_ID=35687 /ORGANISM="Dictyocha speculum, Strain CCMP1381" /LENGTH=119 /DNA_ID=CAMNT_0028464983 /DNA_START=97 /DNA_END=456 /DNA_ORIENTATION=+